MLVKSKIRPFTIFKYLALSIGPLLAGGEVLASTAVRADYDKNDYVLYVTDIIKREELNNTYVQREPAEDIPLDMSGSPGNASVMIEVGMNKFLPNPKDYYAVTGIGIEERWDKPCVITLVGTLVDPRYQGETRVVARHELGHCKQSPAKGYREVDLSENIINFDFRIMGKKFIRAVRVCGGRAAIPTQQAYHSLSWKIKVN